MLNEQTIILNLVPGEVPPMAYVTQDDVGRLIKLVLIDGDAAYNLSPSYTYSLRGTKPSGTGFSYDDAITVSGSNTLTFKTNSVMTAAEGRVRCGVVIYDGDEHVETLNFILMVQKSALTPSTIIDSNDFGEIIGNAVQEYLEEHHIVIDDTLSVAGAAADAKATGDELSELRSQIDLGSVTVELKAALLQLAQNVAYVNENGQDCYDDLYDALYNRYWQVTSTLSHCTSSNGAEQTIKGNPYTATITASSGYTMTGATVSVTMGGVDVTSTYYSNGTISIPAVTGALVITVTAAQAAVASISAVYTQSGTVYDTDTLDSLKTDLVVTATLEDSSTVTVPSADYTLSGTLSAGTSTITVTFREKTDTFTVTVTTSLILNDILTLDGIKNTRSGHSASTTTWEDLSGNGKDFTLNGGTTTVWNDNAAVFNGTSSTREYTYSGVLFPTTLTEWTIELSVKVGSIGTSSYGYPIFGSDTTTWNDREDISALIQDSAKKVQIVWGIGTSVITGDEIAHITYVFRNDGKMFKYLNGVNLSTTGSTFQTNPLGRTTHYLGGAPVQRNKYFTGEIYRFGISSTALTDAEIATRYEALVSRFNT